MSTIPPVKAPQGTEYEPTTRLDFAHGSLPASDRTAPHEPTTNTPPLGLLQAIAGYDPQSAAQQMRGQALELATLLRDKQRLLEQRESELNARAALLESDLRAARLRRFREEPARDARTQPRETCPTAPAENSDPPTLTLRPDSTDECVESHSAEPQDNQQLDRTEPNSGDWVTLERAAADRVARPPDPSAIAKDVDDDMPAPMTTARTSLLAATELNEQLQQIEQQRQQLRQREEKLERRQRHVEQMHDEVTQLHREALELRLASEQVWADLNEEVPREELSQTLATIRAKLADNYRLASDMLACRKDELHELRAELNMQEQRLRQQRRDLQMWADRRYDEIESRMANIILRERELDQLEGEFQRQSLQWQQQRETYRQEIERLSWQLHQRTAG